MTSTFSCLARGRGTWDGQLELGLETTTDTYRDVKPFDEIIHPQIRTDIHRHGVTVRPRARSARPLNGQLSASNNRTLQLPKTYVTRQGALLLFAPSEVAAELTDDQRMTVKKMLSQQKSENCARSFGSLLKLTQSVLTYGTQVCNKEAGDVTEAEEKIYMKFMHTEHSDMLDVKSQPGGEVAGYLRELQSRASSAKRDGAASFLDKQPSSAGCWTDVPICTRQPTPRLSADVSTLAGHLSKPITRSNRVKSAPPSRKSSTRSLGSRQTRHSVDGSSASPHYMTSAHMIRATASDKYESWPTQPTVTPVSSRPPSAHSSLTSDAELASSTEFQPECPQNEVLFSNGTLLEHSTAGTLNSKEQQRRHSSKKLSPLAVFAESGDDVEVALEAVINEGEDVTMADVTIPLQAPYQSCNMEEDTFNMAASVISETREDLSAEVMGEIIKDYKDIEDEVNKSDEDDEHEDEVIQDDEEDDDKLSKISEDCISVCPDVQLLDEDSANSDGSTVPYSGVTAVEVISHHESLPSLHSNMESEKGSSHSLQHSIDEGNEDGTVEVVSACNKSPYVEATPVSENSNLDMSVEIMKATDSRRSSSSSRKKSGSKQQKCLTKLANETEVTEKSKGAKQDTESVKEPYDLLADSLDTEIAVKTEIPAGNNEEEKVDKSQRKELVRKQTAEVLQKDVASPLSLLINNAQETPLKNQSGKPLSMSSVKPADAIRHNCVTVKKEEARPEDSVEITPVTTTTLPKEDVMEQMRKQLNVSFQIDSSLTTKDNDKAVTTKTRAKVKKKEKIKRKDDFRQKQQMMQKDAARNARMQERERRLREAELLEGKIKEKELETKRLAEEAEKKRLEMAEQLALATAEAKEAQLMEEAALAAAAEARRIAKEERDERRKLDMERKKIAAAKRREEEKRILDAARKMERDMLARIGGPDDLLKQEEEDEIRRIQEEKREAEREKEEERLAKKAAQEEEEMILKIEEEASKQAEEQALARLVQSREEAERLKWKLQQEAQELEEAEKKLRDALMEDERKLEAERMRQKQEEEEAERQEMERQRMRELEEAEVSHRMQLEVEKHAHKMMMRRDQNIERRSHLASIQQNQGFTRPWVFSYYIQWPRDTYESLMGDDKKKNVGGKKKTTKTRKP